MSSVFPKKNEKRRLGAEFVFLAKGSEYDLKSYYKLTTSSYFYQANFVYQKKVLSDKTFLALKAGLGLAQTSKEAEYTNTDTSGRSLPEAKTYLTPTAQLGLSFFAIPFKYMVAETGMDYVHNMMDLTSHVGFLRPYISVGVRF